MHDKYEVMLHHYLNERLSDEERLAFEQHLQTCAICRGRLLTGSRLPLPCVMLL